MPIHAERARQRLADLEAVLDVDQQIFDECETAGIWVNSADDPERCTFTLPAVHRQGSVMVAVSTGGASPALSSWLRREIADLIGPEFADIAAELLEKLQGRLFIAHNVRFDYGFLKNEFKRLGLTFKPG